MVLMTRFQLILMVSWGQGDVSQLSFTFGMGGEKVSR
jgi:hypothetical protein